MAGGLDKIREIAERVAQSSGLELVDLELLGGGKAACCGSTSTSRAA